MADDDLDIEAMLEAPYLNGVSMNVAVVFVIYSMYHFLPVM